MSGYVDHGIRHASTGSDPSVGKWINVGTDGVDGVDAELAANPPPYATSDLVSEGGAGPGPPPFRTGTNGFALDADGNPGGGLRYRWEVGGVKIDCGGGITGLAPGDVITTLIGVPLPDKAQRIIDADDAAGAFIAQLLPSGNLVYIGALSGGLDGGGP